MYVMMIMWNVHPALCACQHGCAATAAAACVCSLDADGFPTADTQLTDAARFLQDEVSEPQVLLLQGAEAGEHFGDDADDEGTASMLSADVAATAQVCTWHCTHRCFRLQGTTWHAQGY